MHSLTLKSPAKVNLYLACRGRRRDGFTEIVTLFHRISLCDRLRLVKSKNGIRIHCRNPKVPLGRANLIAKAFHKLKDHKPFEGGVTVYLKKSIPVAGGLGGGSSNAASFLAGVNKLYNLRLSRGVLCRIGSGLGSDIPFFLNGLRHVMAWGRGEKMKAVPFRNKLYFVLCIFETGLSTGKVYKGVIKGSKKLIALTKVTRDVTMLSDFLEHRKSDEASRYLRNDLQSVSIRLKPAIRQVLFCLRMFTPFALMSGSGPSVFGIFKRKTDAVKAAARVRKAAKVRTVVCQTY
ncbi:MAG: 4-(cytidine 5'-diphospho)-2-C-methyl-D-erythritol kinase [Candidatus Omnitrophica bacterium]|nr:4-(cytidine 5'-diphospho)-2-C-methyl-D-erythritol kinase [Candidatus Omnitrophota bacterium]